MTFFKKTTAALATVAILFTNTVFCFAAGYDTVKVTSSTDYRMNYSDSAKFSVKNGTYTKGQNTYGAKVYTIEASPKTTKVMATSGKYVYGKESLSDMLAQTDKGGKTAIAAINADFFDMKVTGLPMGVQITDGRLVATNKNDYDKAQGRVSVGFKADGSTVFGTPEFDISLTVDDFTIKINHVNRQNAYTNHVLLLTSDFADKTYWGVNEKATNYDVIVLETQNAIGVDGKFECHFREYHQNISAPLNIEKNKIYICAPTGFFKGFVEPSYLEYDGEKIFSDESFITVTEKTGKWKGVINAVGGGNLLINGGEIRYPTTYDSSIKNMFTSRSAFGVKADGTYVFYAAERSAGASGVWMDAVAQAMYDMGCVYAVNLDGGGSTTVFADTGTGLNLQNKCQEGKQRQVSNALVLLSDEFAPEVIEDFESEKELTEGFEGTNLVTASIVKENAYTGSGALKLDYSLRGIGNSVSAEFAPIDVTKYKMLSVAVDSNKSGITIEARLKKGKEVFTRTITSSSSDDYARYQVDVSDATALIGFNITYKLSAKNRNTVYIDRIVGLGSDMSADTAAPTLSVKNKDGKITVTATEPLFSAGVDKGGAEITVDGGELLRSNTLNTANYSTDKVHKARIDVTDTLGNRTATYQLFKTAGYSEKLPFADMKDTGWDALPIRYCYENGIINGIKQNGTYVFKGENNITRAEFCKMIVSHKGLDINKYVGVTLPFEDADEIPKWALLYVKAAYAEGIMVGSKTEKGTEFFPNDDIIRAEAAAALDRLITKDTRLINNTKYADEGKFSKWMKKPIKSTTTQGLFKGDKDGKFLPNKNLSRSEAAALMSRL